MNRREPGYLIPSQRRCVHLWSLAARNVISVVTKDGNISPPNTYFTLSVNGTIIYRSEAIEHSANPNWMPLEWQYVDMQPEEAEKLQNPVIQIVIYTISHDVIQRGSLHTPAYFPEITETDFSTDGHRSNAQIHNSNNNESLRNSKEIYNATIDLRELQYIAFDILDVLSTVRPSGEGTGGVRGAKDTASRDDAVELPAEASGFYLDALPLNFLVFWLDDGHYVTRDALTLLRSAIDSNVIVNTQQLNNNSLLSPTALTQTAAIPNGGTPASTVSHVPSVPLTSSGASKKLDLRRSFDAMNRLMQLRRDTKAAYDTTTSILSNIGESTGVLSPTASGALEYSAAVAMVQRIHAMRHASLLLASRAGEEEAALENARLSVTACASTTQHATNALRKMELLLPLMEADIEDARSELSLVRNLVSAKQLTLLAELRALYPIGVGEVERGKRYTIRGFHLPDREQLMNSPDEQVATALGYTCHLVQLAAKYLNVPLRYTPCHMASRSSMRDEAVAHARSFPLYWKGATHEEFDVAVTLLQRDVRQLLWSQGLTPEIHILGSLQRLFTLLLDVPMT